LVKGLLFFMKRTQAINLVPLLLITFKRISYYKRIIPRFNFFMQENCISVSKRRIEREANIQSASICTKLLSYIWNSDIWYERHLSELDKQRTQPLTGSMIGEKIKVRKWIHLCILLLVYSYLLFYSSIYKFFYIYKKNCLKL